MSNARLSIDINAVVENYRYLAGLAGDTACAATVKADAYGLGARPVVQALLASGCRTFFVAHLDEALAIADLIKPYGVNGRRMVDCIVLNGLEIGRADEYIANGVMPTLNALDEVDRWRHALDHYPAAYGEGVRDIGAALHFDTGMNRLGLDPVETREVLEMPGHLKNIKITHVISHLACADDADHPMNRQQLEYFDQIQRRLTPYLEPHVQWSMANSSGIFLGPNYHYDMVRPGMALYGLNPVPYRHKNPMRDVVGLYAPVLQIRSVAKNRTIGYGASHTAERDMVVATVALGYADGFHRTLNDRGRVYWQGHALPVVGRVSMDSIMVDLSSLNPANMPKSGDMIEVIGPHQGADILGRAGKTIGYEILTSLGKRFKRTYKFDQDQLARTVSHKPSETRTQAS